MVINITEKAAVEVSKVIEDQNLENPILRVAIEGGGCSGFQYSLKFDEDFDVEKDIIVEQHGIKVVVDKKSNLFMNGTTIDFRDGLDKRGFVFDNPNAAKSCGCGSSFGV
jgi:iron-sulfur cluster assembly accessory protein